MTSGLDYPRPTCPMHGGLAQGATRVATPGAELLDFGVKDVEGASCRLRLSRAAA
jgi:hypothetical protein